MVGEKKMKNRYYEALLSLTPGPTYFFLLLVYYTCLPRSLDSTPDSTKEAVPKMCEGGRPSWNFIRGQTSIRFQNGNFANGGRYPTADNQARRIEFKIRVSGVNKGDVVAGRLTYSETASGVLD